MVQGFRQDIPVGLSPTGILVLKGDVMKVNFGWDGGIRTHKWQNQNLLPYPFGDIPIIYM